MKKAKKTKSAAKKKPAAKKAAPKKKAAKKVNTKKKPAKKTSKKAAPKKKSAKKVNTKKKPAKKTSKKAAPKKKPAAKKAAPKKKAAKKAAASKSTGKAGKKMRLTAKKQKDFKDMLLAMRSQLTGQIAALQGDSLQRQDAVNSEEDGTDAFERQFALNLASSENDEVFEIDEALKRLDDKTYGVCEECGGGIEPPRLKALPFVRMCIGCQTENEKATRRFRPRPI